LVQLVDEATEEGADTITRSVSLPIITASRAELELEPGEWELAYAAGRLLLDRYPEFLEAIGAEPR
jgi:hypothetical protein